MTYARHAGIVNIYMMLQAPVMPLILSKYKKSSHKYLKHHAFLWNKKKMKCVVLLLIQL